MPILFILLSLADIFLTNRIIATGGSEKNPVIAFCMTRLREWWWVPKTVLSLAIVALLWWFDLTIPMLAACGVEAAIVAWNIKELCR